MDLPTRRRPRVSHLATPPSVPRSSSTPYQLMQSSPLRNIPSSSHLLSTPNGVGTGTGTGGSPLAHSYTVGAFPSPSTPADNRSPIFRRNAGFGSPGSGAFGRAGSADVPVTASGERVLTPSSAMHKPGEARKGPRQNVRFVRKKPLTDRLLALPLDFLDYLSPWLDPVEYLTDPALGYPIGGLLHLVALVAVIVNPASQLSLSGLASGGSRNLEAGQLFAGQGGTRQGLGLGSVRAKRALESRRWLSFSLLLLTLILSLANSVYLFTKTRQYKLWMRSEEERLSSEHTRLVPLELDQDDGKSWVDKAQEKLIDFGLAQLKKVPILGWFTPAPHNTGHTTTRAQIHALEVWEAPVVQLRIFVIFSPLHALFYLIASPVLSLKGPIAWFVSLLLLAGFSAQSWLFMKSYDGLVKDRGLLSAEVMREYDEKFVFPRAMPAVRDATTQTSQAETISWRDVRSAPHGYIHSPSNMVPAARWTSTGAGADYSSTEDESTSAAPPSLESDAPVRRRAGGTTKIRRSVAAGGDSGSGGSGPSTSTPRKGRKSTGSGMTTSGSSRRV